MTTTNNEEYDLLISELFAEAHGLRMKYEEFSQYTEAKIAEFVLERKPMAIRLEQLSRDLAVTNAQRDNARLRVKTLESARSYRIAKKLRRLVPNFFQGK